MRGEVLLPRFSIADLMALREAVAVGIDPAWAASVIDDGPFARAPEAQKRSRAIHAIVQNSVLKQIAELGIELRPVLLGLVQKNGNFLARLREFVQKTADREWLSLR